jgi:hypothetical protein
MQRPQFVFVGLLALFLGAAPDLMTHARDLAKDLAALDAMRKGVETPADDLEKRGAELLAAYPAPKDQGQIYYHLAFYLAQSGMKRPEKIQECASERSADGRNVHARFITHG